MARGNPFTSEQSRSKAAENGRKGGIASGEAKRRKKAMREVLDELLSMPLKKGKLKEIESLADIMDANGKFKNLLDGHVNVSVEQAVLLTQVVLAINGNTKAATFLRDTAGQKVLKDASDNATEYEDDGFTDAIKSSAEEVWKK